MFCLQLYLFNFMSSFPHSLKLLIYYLKNCFRIIKLINFFMQRENLITVSWTFFMFMEFFNMSHILYAEFLIIAQCLCQLICTVMFLV